MQSPEILNPTDHSAPVYRLTVLNTAARSIWAVVVAITILTEVMPIPVLPTVQSYFYCAAKIVLFAGFGYLTPLAFSGFNALSRGITFAAASAVLVECSQGVILQGHSFHLHEMAAKLTLILAGFAFALEARYERSISLGYLRIQLVSDKF